LGLSVCCLRARRHAGGLGRISFVWHGADHHCVPKRTHRTLHLFISIVDAGCGTLRHVGHCLLVILRWTWTTALAYVSSRWRVYPVCIGDIERQRRQLWRVLPLPHCLRVLLKGPHAERCGGCCITLTLPRAAALVVFPVSGPCSAFSKLCCNHSDG
jgi:hypothetical protein